MKATIRVFAVLCLLGVIVFNQLTINELQTQNASLRDQNRRAMAAVSESDEALRNLIEADVMLKSADADLGRANDRLMRANDRLMRACGFSQ